MSEQYVHIENGKAQVRTIEEIIESNSDILKQIVRQQIRNDDEWFEVEGEKEEVRERIEPEGDFQVEEEMEMKGEFLVQAHNQYVAIGKALKILETTEEDGLYCYDDDGDLVLTRDPSYQAYGPLNGQSYSVSDTKIRIPAQFSRKYGISAHTKLSGSWNSNQLRLEVE